MAAQRNSGRKKLPPELSRSVGVRVMMTPGQRADLEHIAEAWGCGMASVVFAFVSDALSTARSSTLDLGCLGIEFSAAVRLHASQASNVMQAKRALRDDGVVPGTAEVLPGG